MKLRVTAFFAIALSSLAVGDTPVITAKIMTTPGFIGGMTLTDTGSMFHSMQDPVLNLQDCFFNGSNMTSALLGNDRACIARGMSGGNLCWFGYGTTTGGIGKYRAFVNSTDISLQYMGTVNWAKTAAISPAGVAWYGKKGSLSQVDVYRDGTILSSFLGATRSTVGTDINNSGQVLWHGWGTNNSNIDVYVDGANVSSALLGSSRMCTSVGINNLGVAAWYGRGSATGGVDHAFKGTTDYSGPRIGASGQARALFINDRGDFVWAQYLKNGQGVSDVFLNDTNLSSNLGTNREAWAMGLGENGDVLWFGSGDNLDAVQDVFLNSTNVSKLALGAGRPASQAVGINNAGWAVWTTPTADQQVETRVSLLCNQTLSGHIDFHGYVGPLSLTGTTIKLREVNRGWELGEVPINVDAQGNFTAQVPTGTFDFTFRANSFLNKKVKNVDTRSGVPITIELAAGDVSADNQVDLRDVNQILVEFGADGGDANGDGITDAFDLNLTLLSFGTSGD